MLHQALLQQNQLPRAHIYCGPEATTIAPIRRVVNKSSIFGGLFGAAGFGIEYALRTLDVTNPLDEMGAPPGTLVLASSVLGVSFTNFLMFIFDKHVTDCEPFVITFSVVMCSVFPALAASSASPTTTDSASAEGSLTQLPSYDIIFPVLYFSMVCSLLIIPAVIMLCTPCCKCDPVESEQMEDI